MKGPLRETALLKKAVNYDWIFSLWQALINKINVIRAQVVQKLDSAIHRINLYPVDNAIGLCNTYPLDSDLSSG